MGKLTSIHVNTITPDNVEETGRINLHVFLTQPVKAAICQVSTDSLCEYVYSHGTPCAHGHLRSYDEEEVGEEGEEEEDAERWQPSL